MTGPLLIVSLLLQDPMVARVKETAYARIPKARAMAQDAEVAAFVAAKNAQKETLEQVHRKDAEWQGPAGLALRRSLTRGDCAGRLRALVQDDPVVVEVLLMDQQGALVCASAETSDYWQGDESKWQRTFVEGRDAFVDEPALDKSTGKYAIQLSVPVLRAAQRVGALTLTLRLSKDAAGEGPRH